EPPARTAADAPAPGNPLYRRPVAIDRGRHQDLRIARLARFDFSAGAQSVPVTASEFKEAHKEFPLVFLRPGEGRIVPAVLLGLRAAENLFVGARGEWLARYLPAFIRRYPFIFAEGAGGRLALCFDEAWEGVGAADGERLFENGAETPYLKGMLDFMSAYQGEFLATERFCRQLDELGLFTPMSAAAELKTGQKFVVQNVLVVDEAKFKALDAAVASRMFQSGELGLVYAHLMSLSNLGRLIDLLAPRLAALQ
ncbi:MAG: SapC family protein, partial [Rhodocyclales bacterium CG17_big_fil_post_rev_8_21_14_2_50_68_7]